VRATSIPSRSTSPSSCSVSTQIEPSRTCTSRMRRPISIHSSSTTPPSRRRSRTTPSPTSAPTSMSPFQAVQGRLVPYEGEARGGDGLLEDVHRRSHALHLGADADRRIGVVDAAGDERPAVVVAADEEVDLVAALRPVVDGPQLPGGRVHVQRLDVAVAGGVEVLIGVLVPGGVVVWRIALFGHADGAASLVLEVLRALRLRRSPIERTSVPSGSHAMRPPKWSPEESWSSSCITQTSATSRRLVLAVPGGALHHDGGSALGSAGVHPVDPAVRRKVRVQRDVEEAGLAPVRGALHAGRGLHLVDGPGEVPLRCAVTDGPRVPFGHEEAPVRQECHPPGCTRPVDDGLYVEGIGLAGDRVLLGECRAGHGGSQRQGPGQGM
jgi:hypothetical protein